MKDDTDRDEAEMIKKLYDIVGNDPGAWVSKAIALFESSDVLLEKYKTTPYDRQDEIQCSFLFDILNIVRMLNGMGMECLLKAAWISSGEILAKDGRFEPSLRAAPHDLYAMAQIVCAKISVAISDDEGMVLARLAYGIESGRYPTPKKISKYPSRPSGLTPYYHRWIEEDEELLKGMIDKIIERIHQVTE